MNLLNLSFYNSLLHEIECKRVPLRFKDAQHLVWLCFACSFHLKDLKTAEFIEKLLGRMIQALSVTFLLFEQDEDVS